MTIEVLERDEYDRPSRVRVTRPRAGAVVVALGQTWRKKNARWRTVTLTSWTRDDDRVFVKRSTSRRRQPISLATLLREYTEA